MFVPVVLRANLAQREFQPGCRAVFFGIEAVENTLFDTLRKGEKFEHIERAIRLAREHRGRIRIASYLPMVFGNVRRDSLARVWRDRLSGAFAEERVRSFITSLKYARDLHGMGWTTPSWSMRLSRTSPFIRRPASIPPGSSSGCGRLRRI